MKMNRREFLTSAALAPLVTVPFMGPAQAAARWGRAVVLVELKGGNDGLNTVVPYTDSTYYSLRPNIAVPKETVLQLDERLGLAKELAPLMALWDQGQLAVALGVGYPDPNLSHFRGIQIWDTGRDAQIWTPDFENHRIKNFGCHARYPKFWISRKVSKFWV